jgi:hypothetical protein
MFRVAGSQPSGEGDADLAELAGEEMIGPLHDLETILARE